MTKVAPHIGAVVAVARDVLVIAVKRQVQHQAIRQIEIGPAGWDRQHGEVRRGAVDGPLGIGHLDPVAARVGQLQGRERQRLTGLAREERPPPGATPAYRWQVSNGPAAFAWSVAERLT